MLISLVFLIIITFITSAVCQRWTSLMIDAGFISFLLASSVLTYTIATLVSSLVLCLSR